MKLSILEMPDTPIELAHWLEQQVVGLHLSDLVTELSAVYPENGSPQTLTDLLEGHSSQVFAEGLSILPLATLRGLLRQPQLLFELQERVLVSGGPYWQTVSITADHQAAIIREKTALDALITAGQVEIRSRPDRHPLRWAAPMAIAAGLLLAVFLFNRPEEPRWGWASSGALAQNVAATEYWQNLTDEAGEWFDAPSTSRKELSQRLREMRHGCDALLAARHQPLPDADRQWLNERCRAWAAKFDEQLASLEQGAPTDQVQKEADATVNKLIDALKYRAARST